MNGNRYFRAFAAVVIILSLAACSNGLRDIRITSADILSFNISSLKSADAKVSLGIYNPARPFTVSDIQARVNYMGSPLAVATSEGFEVGGDTTAVYVLPCSAMLDDSISLINASLLFTGINPENLSVDLSFDLIPQKGRTRKINLKDLDVSFLFDQ